MIFRVATLYSKYPVFSNSNNNNNKMSHTKKQENVAHTQEKRNEQKCALGKPRYCDYLKKKKAKIFLKTY